MQTTSTTVVMPRQPGTAARMVAVFALGAVSAGGLVYAIMARSSPVVMPAAAPLQPVSQPMPPIVVQLVQQPAAPPAAVAPVEALVPQAVGPAFVGPPAPPVVAVLPPVSEPAPAISPVSIPSPVIRPLPSPAAAERIASTKVNLNAASQAELEALPLVGPSMAKRIIEHRTKNGPFRHVKDLDKVKGVGEKTLARLMPLVYVETPGDR
jgi:competence protein ComEA